VVGQVVATNPAPPVSSPEYAIKICKTPLLIQDEGRALIDF